MPKPFGISLGGRRRPASALPPQQQPHHPQQQQSDPSSSALHVDDPPASSSASTSTVFPSLQRLDLATDAPKSRIISGPPPLLTLLFNKPSFLDTMISDADTQLYSISTRGPKTYVHRTTVDGVNQICCVRWPHDLAYIFKEVSSGIVVQMPKARPRAAEDFLKYTALFNARKFTIPHFPNSLKWKKVGNNYNLVCSTVKNVIAILEPAVLSAPPRIRIYEPLYEKDPSRPQLEHAGVPVLLLDYIVITSLLLVTPEDEWLNFSSGTNSHAHSPTKSRASGRTKASKKDRDQDRVAGDDEVAVSAVEQWRNQVAQHPLEPEPSVEPEESRTTSSDLDDQEHGIGAPGIASSSSSSSVNGGGLHVGLSANELKRRSVQSSGTSSSVTYDHPTTPSSMYPSQHQPHHLSHLTRQQQYQSHAHAYPYTHIPAYPPHLQPQIQYSHHPYASSNTFSSGSIPPVPEIPIHYLSSPGSVPSPPPVPPPGPIPSPPIGSGHAGLERSQSISKGLGLPGVPVANSNMNASVNSSPNPGGVGTMTPLSANTPTTPTSLHTSAPGSLNARPWRELPRPPVPGVNTVGHGHVPPPLVSPSLGPGQSSSSMGMGGPPQGSGDFNRSQSVPPKLAQEYEYAYRYPYNTNINHPSQSQVQAQSQTYSHATRSNLSQQLQQHQSPSDYGSHQQLYRTYSGRPNTSIGSAGVIRVPAHSFDVGGDPRYYAQRHLGIGLPVAPGQAEDDEQIQGVGVGVGVGVGISTSNSSGTYTPAHVNAVLNSPLSIQGHANSELSHTSSSGGGGGGGGEGQGQPNISSLTDEFGAWRLGLGPDLMENQSGGGAGTVGGADGGRRESTYEPPPPAYESINFGFGLAPSSAGTVLGVNAVGVGEERDGQF